MPLRWVAAGKVSKEETEKKKKTGKEEVQESVEKRAFFPQNQPARRSGCMHALSASRRTQSGLL